MRFRPPFLGRQTRKRTNRIKPRTFELLEARQVFSGSPMFATVDLIQVANLFEPTRDGPFEPVPAFSSLPGAPATLFLDFDGHFQDQAAITGFPNLRSPSFFIDGNPTTWTAELSSIRSIWARVAEDYAPFNINVTTVDPGDFSHESRNLRVVITGEDFRGANLDAGGVARHGAFSSEADPNVVYVFSISKGLNEDDPAGLRPLGSIANLVSHEAGHAFGLHHQSTFKNGKLVEEYNTGDEKKAPIMGNANSAERGTWWKGTNADGVFQDDMAILASAENGFGYRPDEGASFAEPKQMQVGGRGYEAHGIVNRTRDGEVFRLDTLGGRIEIMAEIARLDGAKIGNLDAVVELFNNQGQLLARAAPDGDIEAALSANVGPGTFFVRVSSQGEMGDVGQFRLVVEEFDPPRVVGSSIVTVAGGNLGVWINFSKPMDAASFTTADVKASGVSILSVTPDSSDPRRFLVTATAPFNAGWSVTVGPDIRDRLNFKMDQNRDGIQGSLSDVYYVSGLSNESSTLDGAGSDAGSTKKVRLQRIIDAAFSRLWGWSACPRRSVVRGRVACPRRPPPWA